jgi:hypothetical protein
MMMAPEKKSNVVPTTVRGFAIGIAMGAAIKVENMQGKKR